MREQWDDLDAMTLCRLVLLYRWVESGSYQQFVAG